MGTKRAAADPTCQRSCRTKERFRCRSTWLSAYFVLAMPGLALAGPITWDTVVNNADLVPGTNRAFNSYNPPSVNTEALVTFRGRSRGAMGAGEPATGVFARDMAVAGPVFNIAQRGDLVPPPNNTGATFTEFPAFSRIDRTSDMIATRGQSQPVWQVIDPSTGETVTKLGTSGIYATPGAGATTTAMSQLGGVSGFSQFQVPNAATGGTDGVKFDQFPGAPSAFDGERIAFKGNYTLPDGTGATGVFYRDTLTGGGTAAVVSIAWSGQAIPAQPGAVFGSTAPPSAANGKIVFTGLDNEDAPTAGGIYEAKVGQPGIRELVRIGETVPGAVNASGTTLNRIGEALSFDGRKVAFWGAWGTETRTVTLTCPAEGNAAVIQSCMDQSGGTGVTTREVPVHQGILLNDVITGDLQLVAETGSESIDYLFWTFSGRPPGVGGGDEGEGEDFEEPRWRSSAFIASDAGRVAFKAVRSLDDPFALYLDLGTAFDPTLLLDATSFGEALDPLAAGLPITALGLERDGFRGNWLVINASMASDEDSWAGVYIARVPVPEPSSLTLLAVAFAVVRLATRRRATARGALRP